MVGGIIVLGLFLTALAAMILVTEQFDSYQGIVNTMAQKDTERFSERLAAVPPGLLNGSQTMHQSYVSCPGGDCNNYTLTVRNMGIGVQIARLYINSSRSPGCTNLCIFDPTYPSAPYDGVEFSFRASDRYVNPGELLHNVTFWLPKSMMLPNSTSGLNTVSIVTTRGRVFSFQWPFPPLGPTEGGAGGGQGGSGLYIGPLVITFDQALIAYTTNSSGKVSIPIDGPNGYWVIPPPKLVIYITIQTDVGVMNDVYLTEKTVFEMAQFNSPGNVFQFFIIAPTNKTLCAKFQNNDPTIDCSSSYDGGNTGDPNRIVPYLPCNKKPYSSCAISDHRYVIPKPTPEQLLNNQRGSPVVVAFGATTAGGTSPQKGEGGFAPGMSVTSFLGLTYVYDDNTAQGEYVYAVTLPFIAICINNSGVFCNL